MRLSPLSTARQARPFSRTSSRRPAVKHRARSRGFFELLEDRLVLATLPAGFSEAPIATGFSSPTAMEFSPIGELWVLEQSGGLNLVLSGGGSFEVANLSVNSSGERGLLGVTFDENYDGAGPNTDYIYLYYTEPAGPSGDPANNRLSRFTVTGAGTETPSIGSELILRDLPPEAEDGNTNHNGGAIHFGPDGKLYVAVGDHNYDSVTQANHVSQILTTPFGKILRLNADGTNPSDNPFYTGSSSDWEGSIWALGLRNPYTFSFDPDSGTMLINDVGEGTWEEINQGEAAANYGWAGSPAPVWEGFENPPPPWANYRDPVMAYDHSNADGAPAGVAITGGVFYPSNGSFGSDYAGLYFFADYGASFIRIFDPANPGQSVNPITTAGDEDTSLPFATGASGAVDLKVDAAGDLYYLARGGGIVYRVSHDGSFIPPQVEDRLVFYNNSVFDNNDPSVGTADDAAIARNKSAYLPDSGMATSDAVTNYARGINGIMIDVSGNHGPLSADDFTFRVGENNTPSSWATAPAPTDVVVRWGAGANGSDRVEILWADGVIASQWLEVTLRGNDEAGGFNENSGLAASDVFYFGNQIGDTFDAAAFFFTDATDEIAARNNQGITASTANVYDFNRDSAVDATDQIIARNNGGFIPAIEIVSDSVPSRPAVDELDAVAAALASGETADGESVGAAAALAERVEAELLVAHAAPSEAASLLQRYMLPSVAQVAAEDSPLDEDVLDALLAELRRR